MIYYIYQITNLVNNKIYIGARKSKSLDDGYMGSGKYIKRAINKYGLENFKKEILNVYDNPVDMYNREAELVNEEFLKREDIYNLKLGGEGGWDYLNNSGLASRSGAKLTEQQKKNISEGLKNRPNNEERFRKLSEALKGNKNGLGNKGNRKPRSEEHKRKISEALKRRACQ
jgi:group I intron endonuclease